MTFNSARLTALIEPSSIAVIGASARRTAMGNEVLANLREEGYAGEISVIHPQAATVDGFRTLPAVADLDRGVDVAVVSLPGPAVVGVLRELEAVGCRAAVVPSTGLSGAPAQEFRDHVRHSAMAVHGPNNMGLLNLTDRIPLWIQHRGVSRLRAGNIGLVSQSGSAAIFVPRASRDGLFSKIISSGSEWQTTSADYIDWLVDDDATEAIGLVLEAIGDPHRFRRAVGRARTAGKPLVVLKVGRSDAGQRATLAHTGALAAPDDSYRALFDELDLPIVDDYDELAAVLEAFSRPGSRRATGTRFAATTISGGQSALLADLAAASGVSPAELSPETSERIGRLIPGGSPSVPVDIGGGVDDGSVSYPEVLRALLADDGVDSLLVACDAQDTLSLAELDVERPAWEAVNAVFASTAKPIVFASSSAQSLSAQFLSEVRAPVAVLRGFKPALAAVRAIAANRAPVRTESEQDRSGIADRATIDGLRGEVAAHDGVLPRALVQRLLDAYRLPSARSLLLRSAAEIPSIAGELDYPLVVKIQSVDIPHRTEAGCVITGVADEAELRAAVDTVLERAAALVDPRRIDGVEVQEQVDERLQAVVGFSTDPVHGAYVVAGSGGVLVELMNDVAGARAPIDAAAAGRMIAQTRFSRLLAGYRGIVERTDPAPLASLISRVSLLAEDFRDLLSEMDLNPVLLRPGDGRPVIVDALLSRGLPEPHPPHASHTRESR